MKQENLTLSEHMIALSSLLDITLFVSLSFFILSYMFTPRVEKIMFIFTLVLLLCAFNCEIKVFRRCGILCFSIYLINAQFD